MRGKIGRILILAVASAALVMVGVAGAFAATSGHHDGHAKTERHHSATTTARTTTDDRSSCFKNICSTWDAQWLKMSIQGDRYEIAAGTLALSKSSNPAVRTLAQTLVTDHSKSLHDAIELAQRLHIDVPSEPTPEQQWILSDLRQHAGAQFDVEFSSVEVLDHEQDIEEANTEVSCGVIQPVKEDAQKELPVLRKHLQLAQAALAASKQEK
jgi:predicted outer membrane protein